MAFEGRLIFDERSKQYLACKIYCDFVRKIYNDNSSALYGIDNKRTELHKNLCDIFDLSDEDTKPFTDNLDKINFDAFELYLQLRDISPKST